MRPTGCILLRKQYTRIPGAGACDLGRDESTKKHSSKHETGAEMGGGMEEKLDLKRSQKRFPSLVGQAEGQCHVQSVTARSGEDE